MIKCVLLYVMCGRSSVISSLQSFHNFIPYSGALLMQLLLGEGGWWKLFCIFTLSHNLHIKIILYYLPVLGWVLTQFQFFLEICVVLSDLLLKSVSIACVSCSSNIPPHHFPCLFCYFFTLGFISFVPFESAYTFLGCILLISHQGSL